MHHLSLKEGKVRRLALQIGHNKRRGGGTEREYTKGGRRDASEGEKGKVKELPAK
jgi:hypothetical protein